MDLRALRYFVAVAEERHVGRVASRLHMTQPPLSRAIRQLEDELGASLLERTPKGVTLTPAGTVMYDEAGVLLRQADRIRSRVTAAAGAATLTIGTLADAAEQVGGRLASLFRARHPHVNVSIHESDLGNPTAGLRAGLVDVVLTRTPFDNTGIKRPAFRSRRRGDA
ncbi:MAG TPA: LysR family transcriptional regulator [Actinoallomurus sp.]|nr:LysR family transcriptional regulator [Actinoallomurus sp.]